ncbi:hypothetical protein DUD43_09130 [Alcaligenes faecalis]|uniref:hypothetical protein n=1 Tax=Alcaligenes faecalis TaxID=511 RepID=UPI0010CA6154|nr:hypothetical protein [Alcaligenes faecalis]QCP82422.1 hypothetical protein D0C27_11240 [Alcaligenes faecalis]QFY77833.1 hypothetical protein DUD43_09130 [Alcaligenes faecalis]
MASRNNNQTPQLSKNEEIALELTKAAVQSGALQRLKDTNGILNRAQNDASYAVALYQSVLSRLAKADS